MHFSRARLRGHRHGQRLTADVLGERVGLTPEQVYDIEHGFREPSELLVVDLADALGLPRHQLHTISATWTEDYIDAVCTYAKPLEPTDARHAAEAMHRRVA